MGALGEEEISSYLADRLFLYLFLDPALSISPLCLLSQGFSASALLMFGAGQFLDAVLGIVGCLAASLTSAHQMPVAPFLHKISLDIAKSSLGSNFP